MPFTTAVLRLYEIRCERVTGNQSVFASDFRMPPGRGKSWKVMEFMKTIFQAWKVMENSKGHGKSWKSHGK